MKAFVKHRYGAPDVLRLEEVERPTPTEEQVLVRVHATAINAHDWHMVRGKPYIARLSEGLRRPKDPSIGLDIAGVVEAVGSAVSHVRPGDRVFGSRYGAFAEYVAGKNMVAMPPSATFEQAAAVPTAGYDRPLILAQGLRDTTVPAPLAFELIADLWTGGANAQFRTYPTGHSETMFASLPDTTGFVAELLRP